MSVLIGHASIDERGTAHGGSAGDQTGKEVCVRSWYANGWSVLLRFKDSDQAEKAARFVEQCCASNMVGYDQWQRNTLRDVAREAGWIGKNIKTKCETDCAAFMTVAAEAAGVNMDNCYLRLSSGGLNAPVTSTMRSKFGATGAFDILTDSKYLTTDAYLKRGDILVKETAHTVMVLSDGAKAGGTTDSSSSSISGYATLRSGSYGNDVKTLQTRLNELGYSCGTVDGSFGSKTLAAVRAFQSKNSLVVDGIVGTQTWTALNSDSAVKNTATTTTSTASYPTVKYGSTGSYVGKLQERLNALGYNCGSVDGSFGAKTLAAVKAYQKKAGLSVDGIVGAKTWAALYA